MFALKWTVKPSGKQILKKAKKKIELHNQFKWKIHYFKHSVYYKIKVDIKKVNISLALEKNHSAETAFDTQQRAGVTCCLFSNISKISQDKYHVTYNSYKHFDHKTSKF